MSRSASLPILEHTIAARPRLIERNLECRSYTLNPYTACDLRCVYCITGAQGVSEPRIPKDSVGAALRVELSDLEADEVVVLGGHCDAYPRAEATVGITRTIVEELVRLRRPFRIVTKGPSVLRDVDLLVDDSCRGVTVSLCSVDETALRRVDPMAPTAAERLAIVAGLHSAGVKVVVAAMPWIPGITDAAAIIASLPKHTRIWFAPLNVTAPAVVGTPFGRRYSQADVNAAYLADFHRVGRPFGVVWQEPVPMGAEPVRPFAGLTCPA